MHTSNTADLQMTTFAIREFTNYKNDMSNKKTSQGKSGDPLICPKDSLLHITLYLK